MPIPRPGKNEEKGKFVSRCVSFLVREGKDSKQAVAICLREWKEKGKSSDKNIKKDSPNS